VPSAANPTQFRFSVSILCIQHKPIDLDETLTRVRAQLRLQEMFRENIDLRERPSDTQRAAAVGAITEGVGLAEKVKDSLSEPFVTTKKSVGRGIGLTIARHTLRNLSGDVNDSENPKGGVTATMIHPL